MLTEFKIKTYIPSLSSFEYVKEVTNKDLILFSKFISSNDEEGACEYLDSLLPTVRTNSLDKFFIILCLRSICIGDQINLKVNTPGLPPTTLKVSIKEVIKKLINIQLQKIPDFIKDDLCIKFKLPSKLYYKNLLFLLYDIIDDVSVKDKLKSIRLASEKEKISIIKKINKDVLKEIKQHIADNTQNIEITKIEDFNNIKICFTNNLAFKVIKIFLSQNISNLYYKL